MAKVSTDMQAVGEILLWIVTACRSKQCQDVYAPTCRKILGWRPKSSYMLQELEEKSHVVMEKPLLKPAIRAKRLKRCRMLVNDIQE